MSSSGFRERGFVPQGRFEGSHAGNQGDGPRQSNTRGFSRGSFNPPRRNDRPQMDTWPPPNPQSFYQHNPHNAPQTWQSRGRFQGNLRHQFRGGSNYPARGTRGSFPRGTAPNFRSPNGRGSQNQYPNQDCRWRFPYRDFPPQNEKPEDPGPPPLGSEEERRQKITDAVDELKRKLLCNDGTSTEDMNLWDDDFNIPGPEPGDEGTLKGIPELMHGPPEIALTTSDLKDIGRVDVDSGQKSTNINENDPDCEIIDVAKSVKTFSEITIHDSEEIPLDLPENSNPDPQINAQENLPEDEGDFTNDECFLKSIELNNFNDDFNIPSNNDGITDENVSEDCPNPSDAPPDAEDVGEAPRNDEKSPEPAKPNDDLQSSNLSSMHPSPVERASPHPFELPQRREPSPDDFVDRKISNKSRSDVNRNKPRVCPVEFTPESLPNANSPTTESRESTSLHKSPRNLNFPQKITVNIKNPLDKRFTPPPLPANRAPQPAEFDILQPPPVFDPRKKNKELQIGNLMPDYNVMCPGGYSMPPMMNLPPVDYGMGPGYSSMTPFVPMNYPPVIPPLDYPTPLGPPPPLNSNLNAGLNPNLNQIPMPENPPPAANEDDAFRELRKAMEFAQELMGMGETDDINFEKECENGFDNFPTLPDLPPPLPPLPVPPAEEEIQKKSKSKKKKKKKETSQEVESPEFPSVSSVLGDSTAAPAAASAPSIPHPPSPSITPPQTISTTPPPRTITTTPPVMIKKEIMSPTKEDRPKVTFNLSLPSKKLEQSNDWREQVVSPVPVVEPDVKPAAGQAESTKRAEKLEKKMEKVVEKPENHPKKQLPTLDLMDLLRSSQFDTLNLFSSPSSSTSRPSHTPEPSETLPTPSTSSKKPQEASWKDRVIGRFLKMSKNDIKNMINNSNLRKFDIAMQHLVKEKKSSLSLEMRNTEDEKIKSKDNVYDKEDFIHQLKQILDPAATVDISDLPTNFIHQLNEVLQLDVLPQEDNTVETTLSNQETTNTPKIDELRQSESSQTLGINAPVISTGDTFKLGKIDKRVSKDTTKSLATSSDSTVNARRGKRCKNPTFTDNNQPNQLNHQFHSPDSSLSSQISVPTEAGALIMDELDDIFTAGINRARMTTKTATQNAKQTSAFTHNYGNNYATNSIISRIETPIVDRVDRIFNTGIAKAKAASKSDDQRIMRSRKGSSDLDFFRNLTKEEYDARYGESSHSSHDNPYKIMNSKNSKKFTDQINGERDQDPFLRTHTYSPRLQNNYGEHSNEDITSDEYDSASSSGSSDNSSDEPSIDVSRMLRFIKEREKMAKKKSLNEEIRDEVTAEIERKRKEKRAHKASRSKKKDRRVKRRKDKHHKNRKKKKKRNYYSGDEETSQDRSLPLLAEHQIKKEPEEEEKVDRRKQMASPQVQRKRPLVGPKSAMAKAALTHQEDPKAPTIRSPSILGAKPTHQPKLSVTNLASGASNPSPTIASPSKHSPAHSSPTSLSSSNSQNPNPFLKTKAQLKQMPEVVKKTFERPGGAEAFKKSLERKGLSTPPHQVRPMAELLGKNAGLETESFDPTVTVKVETVSPTKPASPPVSSVWGPLQSSAEGLGKSLDRVESRSPLTVSEPVESARFTFLQRNKLVEDTAISLAPFVLDNAISLRMNRPQESPQQISSGTSEAEGAKGGSRPKKLDFKAYQERALVRKLRAEGKLPPLLEKIVPDEKIQERSEINQVSGGSTSLNDPVASAAPSPPVLVKETVTKNYLPSEEAKLGDKQRDKVKTMQKSAQIPSSKEKVIDQSDVLKGKVSPPTEAKINANTGRSIPPGPLSSKRRINSGEISKREHNVSSPATEGNTSSQPQKSVEKSGIVEQEKSSQPQKSVKKSEIVEQEKSSQPQKSVKKSEIVEQEKSSQPQKSVKQSEIVEQEKSSQLQKSMKKSEIVEQEKSSQPQKSVKKSEIVEQEKSSQPQKSVKKSEIVEQEKSSQPQKSVEKSGIVEQEKSSQPQKSVEKSGIVEQEKSSQPQKSVEKSGIVEQKKSSQPQKSMEKSGIVEQEKSSQPQKSVKKSELVEQEKSSQPQKSVAKSEIVEQEKSSQPQKSMEKSELVEQEKSSQPQKSVEKSGIVEQEKSSQPQKSAKQSGTIEQEKSAKKGKISLKRRNKFNIHFRLCNRVSSDSLPDVVPVEGLPDTKIQNSNLQQEGISEEAGDTGAPEFVKAPENVDSVLKMTIDDEFDEKEAELSSERLTGVVETTSTSEEAATSELSSTNPSEPLKSPFEDPLSTYDPSEKQILPVTTSNPSDIISQLDVTPELLKNEGIKSLELLEAPAQLNNELQLSTNVPEGLQDTDKVHPASSGITPNPQDYTAQEETENRLEALNDSLIEAPGDSLGVHDASAPSISPLEVPPALQSLQEEALPPESLNSPREPQTSSIENLKGVDLNERNDLASLRADEATWTVDPDHLGPEDLHNLQNIPDSKEEEASFAESHTNWQLEAEISTEEARKNVVLHDRALVVDTPRNSLLDDPIAFATTNNSPTNEGEATDEFGILCENDIEGSIYENQLAETSPIDMINDSSLPLRTSFTPDDELVGGLDNDEDLDQANQVAIVVRELMEVGRKASPDRLPSLILQGMIRETEEEVKTPEQGEEGEGTVNITGEGVKIVGEGDQSTKLDGESAESHREVEDTPKVTENITKTLVEVENIQTLEEAGGTVKITEGDDKTLEEAEEDIKALQEAEEKDAKAPGGHQALDSFDASIPTADEFVRMPELEVEPQMQILAPEDVEHSLNSLVTEESPTSQSTDNQLPNSSRIDDSSAVTKTETSSGIKEGEEVIEEEKSQKTVNQQDEKSKSTQLSENLDNRVDIDSPSSSRPSPTPSEPLPTPSGPSPPPETAKPEEKDKSKDSALEKSKDRHAKKQKDVDPLKKLNKLSTSTRERKKHKHHDKKKSKITEKRVEEAIKSNIVVVSQPTTKIGVMARMREIDIAIQNLMNEKMTLYQMLQNDEWPIPQADVPEQSSVIEEKPKAKSDDPEEKSIVTKTPKVIVSRLPDVLENEQSNTSDTSSSKCVPSDVTPNDTVKPQKNSKNEEKRLPNWEDKIPHKAKKRGHSKDDTEVIKPKEARREGPADSSVSKASEDSNSKKDKKSKTLEEPVRKPVKLSQLIARDFKPKPSVPKAKSSNVSEERGRESRSKSLEKSSAKHKNVSSYVETNESSEVNARSDEKKKRKRKKLSKGAPEGQSLLYSDDSTLDSVDRAASDQKKATGLALLEESMKREAGMKKKQDSKKSKETTADDDNIDFPKSISSKKKHSQRKSNTHGKKLTTSEAPEDSKSKKHVLEVIDAVAKNRITNVQKPGVTKKQEKTEKTPEKVPEDVKKKVKEDPKKSQESKIEAKAQKKIETKLNLIDSDSSDEDVPKQEESTGPADVRTHVKTPSKRLEDSSDEKEKEKEPQEPKKPEGPSDLKTSTLKAAILDDWSDTSSSTSSKGLQKDKKTSQTSKPIVEESEDEVKGILESEKIQKSKQTDIKPSRPEKPVKSKSNAKDSDKKSTSKEADKVIPLEMEKSKKDEKEKPRIPSRVGDESPIEGDDEDEDISIRRKGTSRRSKKLSNRRSNKSSSRSRSRSKRALRSSSRDSSPEIDKVKKRPRSGSSTSSIRSRRKSFTSRTEPHLSRHKRKRQFVERSREEMMNCRVELIDCKYLLTLRPEAHPQTFRRLGISRINPWTPPKCMVLSDEKSRSEDDYQSMIVVEIDDNVGSSSAVELIEDGVDPEEDKMSDKSVCLGFPVSPRVDELAKDRREEQAELGEIEETEVLGRKGREGVSEGDVEVIDIKEEPITTPDSSTEEGCGNGGDEVVEKEVKSSEKEGELKGNNQEPGDGEGKGDDDERERMRYSAHKGPILDIKVFGDSFLAASEDGAIYRYSQKSNGILNIYKGHEAAVTCLYVHEIPGITESKKWFLFSGSLDASLRCYDVMGGILNRPKVTVGSPIQCMDEAWGSIFIGTKSGHISRYDIKTGSLREDKLDFSDKPVLALRASTEGPRKILIVASRNQPITIRDAQSGLFLRTIAGQRTHTVYSLMRDRNLVYCGTSSTSIPVFDFISGEQVTQYTAGVGIVCMRLYQQLLFAGCYDGNIYVFDTKEPKLICSIPGPGNMLLSMEIIDETIIAGSKDRQLHAWRMPPSVRTILLERT